MIRVPEIHCVPQITDCKAKSIRAVPSNLPSCDLLCGEFLGIVWLLVLVGQLGSTDPVGEVREIVARQESALAGGIIQDDARNI